MKRQKKNKANELTIEVWTVCSTIKLAHANPLMLGRHASLDVVSSKLHVKSVSKCRGGGILIRAAYIELFDKDWTLEDENY